MKMRRTDDELEGGNVLCCHCFVQQDGEIKEMTGDLQLRWGYNRSFIYKMREAYSHIFFCAL